MRNFYQRFLLLIISCTAFRICLPGTWKFIFLLFVCFINILLINTAAAQAPADPSSIIGKVVCGYQGWFSATGDRSPINRWTHWSPTNAPQAGVAPNKNSNSTFDVCTDVSINKAGVSVVAENADYNIDFIY